MNGQFIAFQTGTRARCDVCDTEVALIDASLKPAQGYVVCRSLECQRIMKQKSTTSFAFFQRLVQTQKQVVQNRIAIQAAENQRVEKLQTRESEENQQIRTLISMRHPDLPAETQVINIPTGLSELSTLPESRITKYKEHLQQNIHGAAQLADASELTDYIEIKERKKSLQTEQRLNAHPELRVISDQLCGTCKGGCCVLGNDHAFNTVSTMRRFMDANPGLTEEEVLDAYMSRIEPETVENACINQTKTGCGLPREMRSDTCNGFYCNELKSYHRDLSGQDREVKKLIAVQRAHTLWDRLAHEANHDVVAVHLVDIQAVESIELDDQQFKMPAARSYLPSS